MERHVKALFQKRNNLGNPFFLNQFLYMLNEEGMIELDKHSGKWKWDVEKIRHGKITDNVIELMIIRSPTKPPNPAIPCSQIRLSTELNTS